jgi:hypothetical protein
VPGVSVGGSFPHSASYPPSPGRNRAASFQRAPIELGAIQGETVPISADMPVVPSENSVLIETIDLSGPSL